MKFLMGVVMLAGIAMSNSSLMAEFTQLLVEEVRHVREAISTACRVRMRAIHTASLARIIGLVPMALKLDDGNESHAPLSHALIGCRPMLIIFTVFLVPAGFDLF